MWKLFKFIRIATFHLALSSQSGLYLCSFTNMNVLFFKLWNKYCILFSSPVKIHYSKNSPKVCKTSTTKSWRNLDKQITLVRKLKTISKFNIYNTEKLFVFVFDLLFFFLLVSSFLCLQCFNFHHVSMGSNVLAIQTQVCGQPGFPLFSFTIRPEWCYLCLCGGIYGIQEQLLSFF